MLVSLVGSSFVYFFNHYISKTYQLFFLLGACIVSVFRLMPGIVAFSRTLIVKDFTLNRFRAFAEKYPTLHAKSSFSEDSCVVIKNTSFLSGCKYNICSRSCLIHFQREDVEYVVRRNTSCFSSYIVFFST